MRTVEQMLAALEPCLVPQEFVFGCLPESSSVDVAALSPVATFVEREGLTVVVERECARRAGLAVGDVFRCITLGLNSQLDEVGLTAAVATALARAGISANVIAAYHHDHVFVPAGRADEALLVLQTLSESS